MTRWLLFVAIVALPAHLAVAGNPAGTGSAAAALDEGRRLHEAGAYELAAEKLELAVALDPRNAEAHLWLGRSYGRIAERANWLRAIGLARRTLHEFQTAVALDPELQSAWVYLAQYYRRAPAFLGGSRRKAREIEARLEANRPAPPP